MCWRVLDEAHLCRNGAERGVAGVACMIRVPSSMTVGLAYLEWRDGAIGKGGEGMAVGSIMGTRIEVGGNIHWWKFPCFLVARGGLSVHRGACSTKEQYSLSLSMF